MERVIRDSGETPLKLHSHVAGPIAELSFLEKSLLLAELSMIAYNDEDEAGRAAEAVGFPDSCLFDNDGSQAYRFRNATDCVIACRGTEPEEWNDIRADVNVATVLADVVGRVHRGFKREVDDLWPMLEVALATNRLTLWFCGHSLGGAMATICAARCFRSYISSNPAGLFTYGSPRVGNRAYVKYLVDGLGMDAMPDAACGDEAIENPSTGGKGLAHFRWVNNNDVVTRVPPTWAGYRHTGQEVYLDHGGRIVELAGWQRTLDRLRGMLRGIMRWEVDALADHSIHQYVAHIAALAASARPVQEELRRAA